MKAREPAWRVRSAWNSMPSSSKPRRTAAIRSRSARVERAVHEAAGGAAHEPAAGHEHVGGDGEGDQRVEQIPAR